MYHIINVHTYNDQYHVIVHAVESLPLRVGVDVQVDMDLDADIHCTNYFFLHEKIAVPPKYS